MSLYKKTRVHQLEPRDYSQLFAISQLCMNTMQPDSYFLCQLVYFDEWVFYVWDLQKIENFIFRAQGTQ